MAKLQVTDNIFRYKDTGYNIDHITAIRRIQRTLGSSKPKEIPPRLPFDPVIKYTVFTLIGAFLIFVAIKEKNENLFIIAGISTILLLFIVHAKYTSYSERKKLIKTIKNTNNSNIMFGIRITFSNGKEKDFESTNEETISKINNAIRQGMDKEKVSISLDNVNIEIHDSNNVDIGKMGA
jgi:hypothetical protein